MNFNALAIAYFRLNDASAVWVWIGLFLYEVKPVLLNFIIEVVFGEANKSKESLVNFCY